MLTYLVDKIQNLSFDLQSELLTLELNLNSFFKTLFHKEYCFTKGKRIRSILYYHFFDNATFCDKDKKHKIIMLIEILHFASLIHDDVVDQNLHRRNTQSFFSKFGTKTSILFGDYLLSKVYSELKKSKYDDFVETQFLKACSETARGALLELYLSKKPSIENYLKIAYLKTSSIFKLSCLLGPYISGKPFEKVKEAATFGTCFGIIFQAQNDLDCYKMENFKDSEDYMQKNMTLPIIILTEYMGFSKENFNETCEKNYVKIQKAINSEIFEETLKKILDKYIKHILI